MPTYKAYRSRKWLRRILYALAAGAGAYAVVFLVGSLLYLPQNKMLLWSLPLGLFGCAAGVITSLRAENREKAPLPDSPPDPNVRRSFVINALAIFIGSLTYAALIRLITIRLLVGASIFLCSCSDSDSVEAWERSDLVGHCYDLRHRRYGRTFRFMDDGDVVASLWRKKERWATRPSVLWEKEQLWATGPILLWELSTNGVLLIKDHEQKTMMTFFKIASDEKTVTVRNTSGRKEVWLEREAKHSAIRNALGMMTALEAVALLALPLATILYYRRLRRIHISWSSRTCLIVGFLAAFGLILVAGMLVQVIWPNLEELQF
jgi:hypothetical protein